MRSNGMWHVDQPALAADLGDRLLQRHPARDLLLDEEADHLALIGGLHLLGHDHLDRRRPAPRASSAPEISLWSVTAIAPSPARSARLEQHVDRRRAVGRVVGVHVQVDVRSSLREPSRCRTAGRPSRVVAARGDLARRAPRTRRRRATSRAPARARCASRAGARAARRRDTRRSSCAASVAASRGSNSSPRSPSRERLLVDAAGATPPARRRRPSRAAAAAAPARCRPTPPPRSSARARCWASEPSAGPAKRTRSRSAPRQRDGGVGPGRATRPWRARAASGGSRRSARRNRRSAARSSSAEKTISTVSPPSAAAGARTRSAPGLDHAGSRRGSSARPGRAWRRSWRCGRRGGRTAARPACAPPGSRRTRSVGAWNVPTFSACEWRSAADAALGRERLVHVDEVELGARRAAPRSCATRPAAATPSPRRAAGTGGSGRRRASGRSPRTAKSDVRVGGQPLRPSRGPRGPARASPTARRPRPGGRACRARRKAARRSG